VGLPNTSPPLPSSHGATAAEVPPVFSQAFDELRRLLYVAVPVLLRNDNENLQRDGMSWLMCGYIPRCVGSAFDDSLLPALAHPQAVK
jgi:hypothetical protein